MDNGEMETEMVAERDEWWSLGAMNGVAEMRDWWWVYRLVVWLQWTDSLAQLALSRECLSSVWYRQQSQRLEYSLQSW